LAQAFTGLHRARVPGALREIMSVMHYLTESEWCCCSTWSNGGEQRSTTQGKHDDTDIEFWFAYGHAD
jgi:hypothetical protein